ncbi:MAG: DNA polymerase III subunit gamma/tau [Lachnospiraceae bacterium]
MSYTALYRKWRPPVFDDVRGQDPIVSALRNQIINGRTGHAYLFCGTRGTGKTSVAKIFAKAVNCGNPVNGNPCNECPSCRAVNDGISVNVIEIDAASNNGVDNIREIREEVRYAPADGRFKVYIIDEVHMLSTGAFNALLKTLEEPPEHVIFILATTEAYKIPITILSRCQRYDFRRIPAETIAARLKELTDGEHVEIEDRALRYIARKADGSMRDSISLLDQCIAFYYGEALTYDKVLDVLGAVSYDLFGNLLACIIEQRTADCIGMIDEIVLQGRELSQLVSDFIWYLRNLLLLKSSDIDADTLEVSEEDLISLAGMARRVSEETLLRYIRVFSELSGKIRQVPDKRVLLEMTFIKLIRPETEYNLDAVLNRLELLEQRMAAGYVPAGGSAAPGAGGQAGPGGQGNAGMSPSPAGQSRPQRPPVRMTGDQKEQMAILKENWSQVMSALDSKSAKLSLQRARLLPDERGTGFVIQFQDEKSYTIGAREPYLKAVSEAILKVTGIEMALRFAGPASARDGEPGEQELSKVFHGVKIENED